jgi:hypothetical protein
VCKETSVKPTCKATMVFTPAFGWVSGGSSRVGRPDGGSSSFVGVFADLLVALAVAAVARSPSGSGKPHMPRNDTKEHCDEE